MAGQSNEKDANLDGPEWTEEEMYRYARAAMGEPTCLRHDEPLTWEPGGDDQPTIYGRWRCSACDVDLGRALSIPPEKTTEENAQ